MKISRTLFNCSLIISLALISSCGKLNTKRTNPLKAVGNNENIQIIPSVELVTKTYSDGSFEKGSYSFYFLSQDIKVHHDVVDIEFLDTDGSNPVINTQTVVDQIGHIVDLGEYSCKAVPNKNEQSGPYPGKGHSGLPFKEDRVGDPLFWLQYSDMYALLINQANGPTAKVQLGHCYLLQRTNSNYQIIAAFHVKEYLKARSIKIDEIEVFSRQNFK